MAVEYKAGGFAIPGSTGNFSVSGLGFKPQGIVFFGSNKSAEDAVITDVNAGAFVGIMADSGSGLVAQANSIIPLQGSRSHGTDAIMMQSIFSTVEYAASPVSMDADGFTLNFSSVATPRWIHYLAWGDSDNYFAERVSNFNGNITVGWRDQLVFQVGGITSGSATPGDYKRPDLPDYFFSTIGAGAYPIERPNNWHILQQTLNRADNLGQCHAMVFDYHDVFTARLPDIASNIAFVGPFMAQTLPKAYPLNDTDIRRITAGGFANTHIFAYWEGGGFTGSAVPAASVSGVVNQTLTDMEEILAALVFCNVDRGSGPVAFDDGTQAMGIGVKTADYEGCVLVNESGNYLFQSQQQAWCNNATASGHSAGTLEFHDGDFDIITNVNGETQKKVSWMTFGPSGIRHEIPVLGAGYA